MTLPISYPVTATQISKDTIPVLTFSPNNTSELNRLSHLTNNKRRVIRIWDSTSSSPLINHKSEYHSGFTATDNTFHNVREDDFEKEYAEMYEDRTWTRDPTLMRQVVDHVLKNGNTPTPWITTTGNYRYAIFDIARRLALAPTREVHMSVITLSPDSSGIHAYTFDVLKTYELYVREYYDGDVMAESLRVAKALRKVQGSFQRVWFGRIFSSCIEYDSVWTADVS
jgi:hypothetical protein